ncbi:LacI family DNA-binding transcriptional regulator [Marivita geojedonensis]|uniref:LacI family transcriptional regulator n=1 Tax=Marivita geojedonensis TaxID=1123756 RepID=A0A1X4NI89_9RHOB|nr:LacI family DNA-binding transcriptional regulator [Marivita geojedonensis]OSQ47889.1 LacI family transcriptional regulator [Marivita geojedonensis]PRY74708.1 LacI family transcriptional regulator [Marivita geojedonensis]
MTRRVTSFDVAARAGVSQSAVSRVFSGASASKATVEKVREAAEALGYRPNVLARSLITGRSRIIGMVVAYLGNPFYPDALERFSREFQDEGYHTLVFTLPEGAEDTDTDRIIQQMLDHQVDGIVLASVGLGDALAARCEAAGIPVVLFNRGQEGSGLAQVTSANRVGGAKVADFLVAGGHTRIGHVAGWQGSSTGRDRTEGFVARLVELGQDCVGVEDGRYDHAEAVRVTDVLLDKGVDALFVGNDHMAFAVMDHLRCTLDLSVPNDVSVVGYDDVPMAAFAAYDLTTVRQPVGRMVKATVEALINQIEDKSAHAEVTEIDGPLILRGSARRPEGME